MATDRVIFVHLRRPTSELTEGRSDPFWEFGSFGITGCHGNNLMHPRNADLLRGARFAFAQGGDHGTRLVHLTPPIDIAVHADRLEAHWTPPQLPFKYDCAPVLARNPQESDFPRLLESLTKGERESIEAQFSSNYRSRKMAVDSQIAEEVVRVYESRRRAASKPEIASTYIEALPWVPPAPDRDRERTYQHRLDEARGVRPDSDASEAKKKRCKARKVRCGGVKRP